MTYSTTATSSYILSKYSRSYPTSAQAYADWQHFTNPEIHLTLDVERSNNGELQDVRLRVLWVMKDGNDKQAQVVFEDIDLLSFSDKTLRHQQGLPLKAVYRDNLVGVRYLHPKESINTSPTYRRFQVTFASVAVVTEFINVICTVCPCKLNPADNTTLSSVQVQGSNFVAKNMGPPQVPPRVELSVPTADRTVSAVHIPALISKHRAPSDKEAPTLQLSSSQYASSCSQFTSSPTNVDAEHLRSYTLQEPVRESGTSTWMPEFGNRSVQAEQYTRPIIPESQLSSQGTEAHRHQTSCPTLEGSGVRTRSEATDNFLSVVQSASQLYDLSPAALEQIVGKVVREEGFPRLLESLTKLWGLKGLINIHLPN
ncbi:hypothetical protein AX15_006510 [Amanita polypyramis BW_CC]|nr:hypothetical protein AX15_006510 [Amanita polypyramis BW_CC]